MPSEFRQKIMRILPITSKKLKLKTVLLRSKILGEMMRTGLNEESFPRIISNTYYFKVQLKEWLDVIILKPKNSHSFSTLTTWYFICRKDLSLCSILELIIYNSSKNNFPVCAVKEKKKMSELNTFPEKKSVGALP